MRSEYHPAYLLIFRPSTSLVLGLNIDKQCIVATEVKQSKSVSMLVALLGTTTIPWYTDTRTWDALWEETLQSSNDLQKWMDMLWNISWQALQSTDKVNKNIQTQIRPLLSATLTPSPSFFLLPLLATSFCHHHTRLLAKPRIGHTHKHPCMDMEG